MLKHAPGTSVGKVDPLLASARAGSCKLAPNDTAITEQWHTLHTAGVHTVWYTSALFCRQSEKDGLDKLYCIYLDTGGLCLCLI